MQPGEPNTNLFAAPFEMKMQYWLILLLCLPVSVLAFDVSQRADNCHPGVVVFTGSEVKLANGKESVIPAAFVFARTDSIFWALQVNGCSAFMRDARLQCGDHITDLLRMATPGYFCGEPAGRDDGIWLVSDSMMFARLDPAKPTEFFHPKKKKVLSLKVSPEAVAALASFDDSVYARIPAALADVRTAAPAKSPCEGASPFVPDSSGKIVDMGTYSVRTPPGKWEVAPDADRGVVTFSHERAKLGKLLTGRVQGMTQLMAFTDSAVVPEIQGLSASEHADLFLESEEVNMLEQGVAPGLYSVSHVRKGRTCLANRDLFYMSYVATTRENVAIPQALYLYFPADFEQSHRFFGFHWNEYDSGSIYVGGPESAAIEQLISSLTFKPYVSP
jgi:hypothetical protein